jgi:TfoX/Sxy family transcriptional regulator of competence genes
MKPATVTKTTKRPRSASVSKKKASVAPSDSRFSKLVSTLGSEPGIEIGSMFGSTGLKIGGKVFAMEVKGELVVKLPAARVAELLAADVGTSFDPGHGRLMKEWVAIASGTASEWIAYAREAQAFITNNSRKRSVK